jgi:hypothetical protein
MTPLGFWPRYQRSEPLVVGQINPSATYCLINDVVIVVRVDQIGVTMGVSWDATTRPAAVS